jgi:hypothetical protein
MALYHPPSVLAIMNTIGLATALFTSLDIHEPFQSTTFLDVPVGLD